MIAIIMAALVEALAFNLAYAYIWNVQAFPATMTDQGWKAAILVVVSLFLCNCALAVVSRWLADQRADARVSQADYTALQARFKAAQRALITADQPRLIVDHGTSGINVEMIEPTRVAAVLRDIENS